MSPYTHRHAFINTVAYNLVQQIVLNFLTKQTETYHFIQLIKLSGSLCRTWLYGSSCYNWPKDNLPFQVRVMKIFLLTTSVLLLSPRSCWGFRRINGATLARVGIRPLRWEDRIQTLVMLRCRHSGEVSVCSASARGARKEGPCLPRPPTPLLENTMILHF